MGVSVALAIVFDSMTAALFFPLAQSANSAPFVAIKSWFDFLFAAAGVPYGLGFIAVLWADLGRSEPLLPRAVRMWGSPSEPRRRSAGSDMCSASCICRWSSASP